MNLTKELECHNTNDCSYHKALSVCEAIYFINILSAVDFIETGCRPAA